MACGASAAYQFVGQSTQVGLALLVFGSRATSKVLANASTANVKTGWGGLLGNKGSCFWRAEDAAAGVKLKGQVDRLTALRRVDGEFGLLFEGTRQLLARASSVEERERWECAVQRAIQQGAAATAA